MHLWQDKLVRWRCGLPKAEVEKLRGNGAWSCRDLKIVVGRVTVDDLGKERAERLKLVPTRFKLPAETVDEVIAAGGDALLQNLTYRNFLGSL